MGGRERISSRRVAGFISHSQAYACAQISMETQGQLEFAIHTTKTRMDLILCILHSLDFSTPLNSLTHLTHVLISPNEHTNEQHPNTQPTTAPTQASNKQQIYDLAASSSNSSCLIRSLWSCVPPPAPAPTPTRIFIISTSCAR